jgi:hypothetical protein
MARQPDDESMRRLATQVTSGGLTREDVREVRRQESAPRLAPESKPYSFRYAAPQKEFTLEIKFRRANVTSREVAAALHEAMQMIEAQAIEQQTLPVDAQPEPEDEAQLEESQE